MCWTLLLSAATSGPVFAQASLLRIQDRTYKLREAGDLDMPYSLYVPKSYYASGKWPLIVALHGTGGDGRSLMRYQGLTDFAESYGYIVVTPLGYSRNSSYGIPERGQGRQPGEPGFENEAKLTLGFRELAELDVMTVLAMVRKEFNVDEDRIYLMGHSMGAAGVYYLAEKYPEIWAGLAAISGGPPGGWGGTAPSAGARIQHLPILVMQGDMDTTVPVARTRAAVAQLRKLGMQHVYLEIPGGDHSLFIARHPRNLQKVFFFFNIVSKSGA
jgi:predicted peptidase